MSIAYCHNCNRNYDQDYEVEHEVDCGAVDTPKYSAKTYSEMETFLENALKGQDYPITYEVSGSLDSFYISGAAVRFLKEVDHDCRGADGCSFCSYLVELGLLPEGDYDPNDYADTIYEQYAERERLGK